MHFIILNFWVSFFSDHLRNPTVHESERQENYIIIMILIMGRDSQCTSQIWTRFARSILQISRGMLSEVIGVFKGTSANAIRWRNCSILKCSCLYLRLNTERTIWLLNFIGNCLNKYRSETIHSLLAVQDLVKNNFPKLQSRPASPSCWACRSINGLPHRSDVFPSPDR